MEKVIILPLDGYKNGNHLLEVLGKILKEPGVKELLAFVKLNDAVHNLDFGGPKIYQEIEKLLQEHEVEVGIFLDLKIFDVSETLKNVLKKYISSQPGILTVSSGCSVKGILELRRLLPLTTLAMISVPTDISQDECQARFGMSPEIKIYNDLMNIRREYAKIIQPGDKEEPFDLIVCSYHELGFLEQNVKGFYGYIVPGIRDEWMKKPGEHQKRTAGVIDALNMGATYVVMGAQMTKGNEEMGISAEESRRRTLELLTEFFGDTIDPLKILTKRGGYYCSPKKSDGSPLGPLVGYAGTYEDESGQKMNYVGIEYFNFAKLEEDPESLYFVADLLAEKTNQTKIKPTLIIGAPMGGLLLASELGGDMNCRTIFAEKKVTALADPEHGKKETSELVIDRHEIYPGDKVIIVEDVCNNFSTTEKMMEIIESKGGQLAAIACAFNRSGKENWNDIPVISACSIPAKQWKQNDPEIAELIQSGNIVWKPKLDWVRLKKAMEDGV